MFNIGKYGKNFFIFVTNCGYQVSKKSDYFSLLSPPPYQHLYGINFGKCDEKCS